MDDTNLLVLLNHKIEMLKNINDLGIIWWTSTIVLSITIIGFLWHKKEEVRTYKHKNSLINIISIFFVSVCAFGMLMIIVLFFIQSEYNVIRQELTIDATLTKTFVFWGSVSGFALGSFVFACIFIIWKKFSEDFKD